ncbi:MAG: MurR/RpiR family transcriptional regulator [Anaerocolumna sp.]
MKSVLIRLQEYSSKAGGAEKEAIKYLLKNPDRAVKCTIHELSENTFSSPSTIIRLCKKLGFQGYKDFNKSLISELAIRNSTNADKKKEISNEDSLELIVDKVTYKNISSLENTRNLLDMKVLETCVDLITNARTICLFGMGSSLLVAKDAYLKFLRINKPCIISDDWHAQLLQARNITKEDVAIVISYSGLTEEVLKCVNTIKEKGAPIIAITRFDDTPLSRAADYNLCVAATEFIFRSGAMSSRIGQLNMIDILYTAYINRQYESSITQFQHTHIDKPHNINHLKEEDGLD